MCSKRLLILAASSGALAGCNTTYTHIGDDAAGLGEAVRYDAAIQTINPAPVYTAQDAQPGDNGEVGAHAVKRYRSGSVKAPEAVGTSSGGSGSGGGGPQ